MEETLQKAIRGARAVRFLCTGNMVRSAFAELYARHLGAPVEVDSAATVYQNDGLFHETREALLARGLAPGTLDAFQPRHLSRLDDSPPDDLLVLGMTVDHLAAWRARFPQHENAFRLAAMLGRDEDIADPVLEGASFDRTFEWVAGCVEALVVELASTR